MSGCFGSEFIEFGGGHTFVDTDGHLERRGERVRWEGSETHVAWTAQHTHTPQQSRTQQAQAIQIQFARAGIFKQTRHEHACDASVMHMTCIPRRHTHECAYAVSQPCRA